MKNRPSSSASSLFLMELIIAILFFCLTATACVQLFFKSHELSEGARELNSAVNICTGAAEIIAVSDNVNPYITKTYYDENMNESVENDSEYVLTVRTKEKNSMLYADITMECIEDGKIIYDLSICRDIKNNVREEKGQ